MQAIHFVRWVEKYKETKTTHISTLHKHTYQRYTIDTNP